MDAMAFHSEFMMFGRRLLVSYIASVVLDTQNL